MTTRLKAAARKLQGAAGVVAVAAGVGLALGLWAALVAVGVGLCLAAFLDEGDQP